MNNCVSTSSADFTSLYREVFKTDVVDAGLQWLLAT